MNITNLVPIKKYETILKCTTAGKLCAFVGLQECRRVGVGKGRGRVKDNYEVVSAGAYGGMPLRNSTPIKWWGCKILTDL